MRLDWEPREERGGREREQKRRGWGYVLVGVCMTLFTSSECSLLTLLEVTSNFDISSWFFEMLKVFFHLS